MNTNTHRIISDTVVSRSNNYDFLSISCTPAGEECTQVNRHPEEDNILECNVYINQLLRHFGEPPSGAYYFILKNTSHNAGIYYEAAIRFNANNEDATDYAYKVEDGCNNWDDTAKQELKDAGYCLFTSATPVVQLRRA